MNLSGFYCGVAFSTPRLFSGQCGLWCVGGAVRPTSSLTGTQGSFSLGSAFPCLTFGRNLGRPRSSRSQPHFHANCFFKYRNLLLSQGTGNILPSHLSTFPSSLSFQAHVVQRSPRRNIGRSERRKLRPEVNMLQYSMPPDPDMRTRFWIGTTIYGNFTQSHSGVEDSV